jgi:hypothetical protein
LLNSLAEELNLQLGQLRQWLKIAVAQGKVTKKTKPVRDVATHQTAQLSLLD